MSVTAATDDGADPTVSKPADKQLFWQNQIQIAEKEMQQFWKRGNQIVSRYLDDNRDFMNSMNNPRRFNLFHSNVNIMKAALYSKLPKPEVMRRFKDPDDDIARVASKILERNLEYELQEGDAYDEVFKSIVMDRLLAGMGVTWQRYEAITGVSTSKVGETPVETETIEAESTPIDYVYWEDLMWSPARTWKEVWWVARKVYLTKEEGTKKFGKKFDSVPLNKTSTKSGEAQATNVGPKNMALKRGCVYEIWNKKTKKIIWMATTGPTEVLDEKPDFLKLPGFFPIPKPLFASITTSNLIPQADYMLCQDQYEELDIINTRISYLIQACKVVGVYDKKSDGIVRMLQQGVENQLIPVDQWAAFAEKGGVKGAVDWLPIEHVANVISQLNLARDTIKQQIYELTGLADIIRGASQASETAAAQKIKAQYASVRLTTQQEEVAAFLTNVFNLKAYLMCKFYQPEKLLQQAGTFPEEDKQFIEPAIQLLKNEYERKFRILVTSDTFTDVDWQREQEERMMFLTQAGQFIEKAAAAAETSPESAPMMFGLLKFAVAGFRASRDVEGIIDQGATAAMAALKQKQENPQPDPEQQKLQAEMQMKQQEQQGKMQSDQQKHQLEMAKLQAEMVADKAMNDAKITMMQQELEFAREKHMLEMQALREKFQIQAQGDMMKAATKAQSDQQTHQQNLEQSEADHQMSLRHAEEAAEVAPEKDSD